MKDQGFPLTETRYDEAGFDGLLKMQRDHFWYRGRHRFLLNMMRKVIFQYYGADHALKAIDMGGGCGGWIEYLQLHDPGRFEEIALGDCSIRALSLAESVVGPEVRRFQMDLLDLSWKNEWDVVFLLDVIEHIPDHEEALRQVGKSIRPGGLIFVTAPAFSSLWSYNDTLAGHQRRYRKHDFKELSNRVGLKFLRANYFMFFLSPLLALSRLLNRPPKQANREQLRSHINRTHKTPIYPINEILFKLFSIESWMVNYVPPPWGTSVLAIFQGIEE